MIQRGLCLLAVLATGLISPVAWAGAEREFVQELITLDADDGVRVAAILTYPSAGINTHSPAIIYQHGLGGNPLQALGAPRFISEPLAAHGYVGIGILSRHSSEDRDIAFEKAVLDTKAAADWLAQLGISDIVLVGHSLGSVRSSSYWNETHDARIKAMVHFAPTRDLSNWVRAGFGDERYEEVVGRLQKMIEDGRGDEYVYDTFELPPPAPAGMERGLPHTAETWLNWMGPSAQTSNTQLFANLDMPLLMLAGDADIYVTKEYMRSLKEAAVKSPRVDTVWYEGGVDHIFMSASERARAGAADWHERVDLNSDADAGAEVFSDTEELIGEAGVTVREQAAQDTIDWLEDIGLGVRPRISTAIVDAKASDGIEQSGILYRPEAGSDPSRIVFVILHDYAGNAMNGSSEWLSVSLAQAGHTVLAPRSRAAGSASFSSLFQRVTEDTSGWIDYLESRGHKRVVLVGEGWGGVGASYYKSANRDPRVVGIAYLNPTTDGPSWARNALGPKNYERLVAAAKGEVTAGNGNRRMIYARGELPPPASPGITRLWHQTAESFLSEWGPDAMTNHAEILPQLNVPILALGIAGNTVIDLQGLKNFSKAAGEFANYNWRDSNDHVSEDILLWANRFSAVGDGDQ
jgi:dienelactone hydrolase